VNGDRRNWASFAGPPRDVPGALAAQLLFGGAMGFLGWFFCGFGLIFCWIFAANSDVMALVAFHGVLETAEGKILASDKTAFSQGGGEGRDGTPIYAFRYEFTHQGESYEGESYQLGPSAELGEQVTIEFPAGRPEWSRIQGMRTAPFGWPALFVVVFPLIGSGFVLGRLRGGFRSLHLLKHGEISSARLTLREPTNTSINNQTVYRLTFEFETARGDTAQCVVRTHETQRLTDDEWETVLYDPLRPERGTTLDHLPGSPRIAEDGTITLQNARSGWLALVLPSLTLFGHGAVLISRWR
jgi:hypothetical protein